MNGYLLFRLRLRRHSAKQLRVWKSALDWTVLVYLLVPGIVLGIGFYTDMLRGRAQWVDDIPWSLYPIPLALLVLISGLRLFVEEADKLFLLQRPGLLLRIRTLGIAYTAGWFALTTAFPFLLLLPFLLYTNIWTPTAVALAYVYTVLLRMIAATAFSISGCLWGGWRKWLLLTLLVILLLVGYLFPLFAFPSDTGRLAAASLAAAFSAALLLYIKLRLPLNLNEEVKRERINQMRSTELLMSQVIEKQPLVRFRRPLLFRQSGRIFRSSAPAAMLAEMRLKAFLRKFAYIRTLLGFFSLSSGVLLTVPGLVAWIAAALLVLLASSWINMHWRNWTEEAIVAHFPWRKDDLRRGEASSRFWLLLPGIVLWSAAAGWQSFGGWGALGAVVLCLPLWWLAHYAK